MSIHWVFSYTGARDDTYLLLLELGPVLLVIDHEASGGLGVWHLECVVLSWSWCVGYGEVKIE